MSVVKEIVRFICGLIDGIAYDVISAIYNVFYELVNIIMYDREVFDALGKRIGLILGIVMLFRLAVSLISYIINPDKMKDTNQGAKKIITNVAVSLVLLATINIIFEKAYVLQKKVIETKIVEKVLFGEQATVTNVDIAYMLYTGFVSPNTDILPGCDNLFNATYSFDETCSNSLSAANLSAAAKNIIKDDIVKNHNFSEIFSEYSLLNAKKSGKFIFNYTPIISTVAAVVVILVLISFCMDTATRMIKLVFYQIIAPIPIIANMMPGKGAEIFKKWYKECLSTYLSVFLRIVALNFAVFMITLITVNYSDLFVKKSFFITVFIIIGCLMFAKQLPKLIEEIFGIKSDGMLLHPLKKFQEQALFGKEITGISKGLTRGVTAAALGTVTGAAGGLIAGQKLSNEEGVKRVLTGAGQTIRGSLRGMAGSFVGGIKSKGMIQAVGTGVGGFQRNADYVNSLDGTTLTGRMKAGLEQRLHIATDADRTKLELDELDKFIQTTDAALKRAEAESIKYNTLELKDDNGNIIITMQQHKAKQQQLIRMQNEQIDKKDSKYWVKHNGQYYFDDITYENDKIARDDEIAKLQDEISINQKKFAQAYITQVGNRKLRGNDGKLVEDGELDNYVNQMKHYQDKLAEKGHEYKIIDDDKKIIGDIKKAKQDATVKKQEIENNYNENNVNVYQQQQANAAATKPKGK